MKFGEEVDIEILRKAEGIIGFGVSSVYYAGKFQHSKVSILVFALPDEVPEEEITEEPPVGRYYWVSETAFNEAVKEGL